MKFRDAQVGEYYVLKKNPGSNTYNAVSATTKVQPREYPYGRNLKKGDYLVCTKVDRQSYYKSSTYVKVNTAGTKVKSSHIYTFTSHAPLKLSDNIKYKDMSEREIRAAKLREGIKEKKKEAAALKRQFDALEAEILEEKQTASNLERFKSDAEELAHTFSKIIATGGDEASILQILENRASTKNL